MNEETTTEVTEETAETIDGPKFSDRLKELRTGAENDRLNQLIDVLIEDAIEYGF